MTQLRQRTIMVSLLLVIVAGVGISSPSLFKQNTPQASTVEATTRPIADITYKGADGKTILELLQANHTIKTMDQGSLGIYVTSIDGVEANESGVWVFYIDGAIGKGSVEETMTTNEQTIEWRYERF